MKRNAFVDYVVGDLLSGLTGVSARAMFGGYGLYRHETFFGIIAGDVLYFKVSEASRKKYEAAGSKPFSYDSKTGRKVMKSYFEVPAEVLEHPKAAVQWAAEACGSKSS